MNASKNETLPEEDRRYHYIQGTKSINLAFKANQKNSAAANALCELLLRKGQSEKVSYQLLSSDLQCAHRSLAGLEAGRKDHSICRYPDYSHGRLHSSGSCLAFFELVCRSAEVLLKGQGGAAGECFGLRRTCTSAAEAWCALFHPLISCAGMNESMPL